MGRKLAILGNSVAPSKLSRPVRVQKGSSMLDEDSWMLVHGCVQLRVLKLTIRPPC